MATLMESCRVTSCGMLKCKKFVAKICCQYFSKNEDTRRSIDSSFVLRKQQVLYHQTSSGISSTLFCRFIGSRKENNRKENNSTLKTRTWQTKPHKILLANKFNNKHSSRQIDRTPQTCTVEHTPRYQMQQTLE